MKSNKNKQKLISVIILAVLCSSVWFCGLYANEVKLWQEANGIGHENMYVYENTSIVLLILAAFLTAILDIIQGGIYRVRARLKAFMATLDERQKQAHSEVFSRSYNSLVIVVPAVLFVWNSQYDMQMIGLSIVLFFFMPSLFAAWNKKA